MEEKMNPLPSNQNTLGESKFRLVWSCTPAWEEIECLAREFSGHSVARFALEWNYHLEKTAPQDKPYIYYIVRFFDGDELRAFAIVFLTRQLKLSEYLGKWVARSANVLEKVGLRFPLLTVGMTDFLDYSTTGFYLKNGETVACEEALLMLQALTNALWENPRGMDFFCIKADSGDPIASTRLRNLNLFPVTFIPETYLELPFENFAQYVRSLSPNERQNINYTKRRAAKAGVKAEILEYAHAGPEGWYDLIQKNFDKVKQENRMPLPFEMTKEFFHRIPSFQTKLSFVLVKKHSEIVAIGLLHHIAPEVLSWKFVGFDYDRVQDVNSYKLIIYKQVEYAIDHGYALMQWGSGCYETKTRLGAKLYPRCYWIQFHKWKFLKWVFNLTGSMRDKQMGLNPELAPNDRH